MIRPQMFSRRFEPVGQQVWSFPANALTGPFNFVVPDGVTKISAVLVGAYLGIFRVSTPLLAGYTPIGSGVGGGDGGSPGGGDGRPGGGGAGGYTDNGGKGGDSVQAPAPTSYIGSYGSAGLGGGGGGGGGRDSSGSAGAGGGVRLTGQGNNGAYGAPNYNGGDGSSNIGSGSAYGGGLPGRAGANLRWLNDIPVTPGETLKIEILSASQFTSGVRIMWGGGRSFPSNAGDV